MKYTLKLSLKNLTRQKRRNSILAIAIAFGFLVVSLIDGFVSGIVGNLEDQITQLLGGTVLIQGCEKIVQESGKPKLVIIVRDRNYIRDIVEKNDIKYESLSCYSSAASTLIFNGTKSIVELFGRDFTEKKLVNSFLFAEGSKENLAWKNALLLSEQTAEGLNVKVGDQLIITTSTIYGQNAVADFTVAGIIKSNSFMSSMQAYCDIETLNELIEIPEGGYSTFTIFLKNKKDQGKVANLIEQKIREDGVEVTSRAEAIKNYPANIGRGIEKQLIPSEILWEGTKYAVETLYDEIPAIQTVMNIVHIVTTIILLVILLIVMVGVSNTYRMVLYERIREIGTMRALGMEGSDTRKVFTGEAVILCVLGAVLGLVMSLIIMGIVHLIPINSEVLSMFLYKNHFSFKISIGTIILQYVLLIVLTALAVRGSANKASKMNPAEALRTVK